MKAGVKEIMSKPLSDSDIRHFIPNAPIKKYSELAQYSSLSQLLPEVKSFCFILYEHSFNSGHWTQICKLDENTVCYFDSYGGYVDAPLKWTDKQVRIGLGESKPLLSILFKECPEEVVYNKVKYQKESSKINDCGRFCVLWTMKMLEGMNLNDFHKYMVKQKRVLKGDYDEVVSMLIR